MYVKLFVEAIVCSLPQQRLPSKQDCPATKIAQLQEWESCLLKWISSGKMGKTYSSITITTSTVQSERNIMITWMNKIKRDHQKMVQILKNFKLLAINFKL